MATEFKKISSYGTIDDTTTEHKHGTTYETEHKSLLKRVKINHGVFHRLCQVCSRCLLWLSSFRFRNTELEKHFIRQHYRTPLYFWAASAFSLLLIIFFVISVWVGWWPFISKNSVINALFLTPTAGASLLLAIASRIPSLRDNYWVPIAMCLAIFLQFGCCSQLLLELFVFPSGLRDPLVCKERDLATPFESVNM